MQKRAKEKLVAIGFRGTRQYRQSAREAALKRKMTVQKMLEEALAAFLDTDPEQGLVYTREERNLCDRLVLARRSGLLPEHFDHFLDELLRTVEITS